MSRYAARLAQFQLWRIGTDDRTMGEVGLNPENISAAINGVLNELNQEKQQNAELVESLQNMARIINNRPDDQLTDENASLREALTDISNMCVGEIAMGYKLDSQSIGQLIFEATGLTNPEMNALRKKDTK